MAETTNSTDLWSGFFTGLGDIAKEVIGTGIDIWKDQSDAELLKIQSEIEATKQETLATIEAERTKQSMLQIQLEKLKESGKLPIIIGIVSIAGIGLFLLLKKRR